MAWVATGLKKKRRGNKPEIWYLKQGNDKKNHGLQAASPPPASSPTLFYLDPAVPISLAAAKPAANNVDGEKEEKGSYLVESFQTEIRPLLIFASTRRFVSSLKQCLNRVNGIEARGRAGGEQGASRATVLQLILLYNGSVLSLD
ncbi:hypothetical protein TIFTF001_016881 [Ficus carica]|uniref:Uncharacterized protein n=1 Tax=Ficus carica TaxID=3494 RepID=A0AA88ATT8_FICCA|nr:hypothetical protein TIFTF001_016881 [Ficus carica]